MEQATNIGLVVTAILALIGGVKFIEERERKKVVETNLLREQQIKATYDQILAMQEMSGDMKELSVKLNSFQVELANHSDKISRLENHVFYMKRKDQ